MKWKPIAASGAAVLAVLCVVLCILFPWETVRLRKDLHRLSEKMWSWKAPAGVAPARWKELTGLFETAMVNTIVVPENVDMRRFEEFRDETMRSEAVDVQRIRQLWTMYRTSVVGSGRKPYQLIQYTADEIDEILNELESQRR